MRTMRIARLCVAVLVAAVGVGVAVAGLRGLQHPSGLLKNPGFEEQGRPPAGWTLDAEVSGKGRVDIVPSPFGAGHAAALRPTAANTDTHKPFGIGQAVPAAAYRGKKLYLAGSLSASGRAVAVAGAFVLSTSGAVLASATLTRGVASLSEARMEDILSLPDTPDAAQIVFVCIVNGTSGTAVFDDLALTLAVPARLQANRPDPGPPLPARFEVGVARVKRTIPRTLYGINTEWVWNGNGIWDEARGRLDPEILRLTRDLGVSLIRFPGGTFSDYYHWRDGLGLQAKRPWQPGLPGETKSRHTLGTEEMLDFARRTGARLLLTANVGTGTAQEAADWVRYVNRGSDRKSSVTWWEIGNEVYMDDGSPSTRPIAMTPRQYAEKCAEFARAMRRADRGIKIGAISNESYWNTTHRNWDEVVLGRVSPLVDFIAVHNAYAPVVVNDGGRTVREVYRATVGATAHVRASFAALSGRIGKLPKADARRLRIAVTEWGTLYHVLPSSRFVDHCKTLGSALYTASAMLAFIENPRVEVATYFKLVDKLFIGAIGLRGERFAPTASYLALQMFTRHFGTQLLESRVASPTFDSPALGWAPPVRRAAYLECSASLSADRKTLYIIAVNRHFDRAMRISLNVRGFAPASDAKEWLLTGTGLDAHTGTGPLSVPGITWAKQAEDEANPRFSKGGPGEVSLKGRAVRRASATMAWTIPAHSVACLELRRR